MGINFPAAPIIGELYPTPAIAGIPQYTWDGTAWLAMTPSALTYVQRGGDTMTGHLTLPTSPAAANAVRRDFVEAYAAPFDAMSTSGMQINGGFEISQEKGTTQTTTSNYVCDGWVLQFNGTMAPFAAADAGVPYAGLQSRLYTAATVAQPSLAAGNYVFLVQPVEGYRTSRLAWGGSDAKPITIAFWSQHTVVGTYCVSVRNGTSDRSYVTTYTQNVANAFEYKSITIPGCTSGTWGVTNGSGLVISFAAACGATYIAPSINTWLTGNYLAALGQVNAVSATNQYVVLRGVVVLPGSQAPTAAQSPLIMRPYDQELLTCQRYYRKLGGFTAEPSLQAYAGTASINFTQETVFAPDMRSAPTITKNGTWQALNCGQPAVNGHGAFGFNWFVTSTAAGNVVCQSVDATTFFSIDARL